jgi:uncharacterized DUF497 family protein
VLFEWDDRKAAQNASKHGVPFEYAARVFLDPHRLDREDNRRDYKEERRLTLGKIEERLFAIAYTARGKVIRRTNVSRESTMKTYELDPKNLRQLTPAELRRLDSTPIDYSDIPALGEDFFANVKAAWPPAKHQLTIRLDADVLNWLKANGRGYQTRINHILRAAMESTVALPKKKTRNG